MNKKIESKTNELINFVDRFSMYDSVFNEYLNTMTLINEKKSLMFENFNTLSRNYRKNVQIFAAEALTLSKSLQQELDVKSFNEIICSLSAYVKYLNEIWGCVDFDKDIMDSAQQQAILKKIINERNRLSLSIQLATVR